MPSGFYERIKTIPICHPERKHHSKGLCASCYRKKRRKTLPETHREEQRLYYARNRKKIRNTRKVRGKTLGYARMASGRRRARKTQAGGHFTIEQWLWLCREAGFRCLCCKKKKPLEADHVIPISKGGTSWIWNIQPLCRVCNGKKYNKVIDYRFQ